MSVYPCSRHGQRAPGKLASVYWAWFLADGTRRAYRERLCVPCYAQYVVSFAIEAQNAPENCPVCHTAVNGDADPCFATSYRPGNEPDEIMFNTCGVCAVEMRAPIVAGGIPLDDRTLGTSGEGPRPLTQASPTAAWDTLGLRGPDTHD
jgi:hypothetical protein